MNNENTIQALEAALIIAKMPFGADVKEYAASQLAGYRFWVVEEALAIYEAAYARVKARAEG